MGLPGQVGMDVVHHQTLHQLNKRVSPRDTIVGWCALPGLAWPARPCPALHSATATATTSSSSNLLVPAVQVLFGLRAAGTHR